MRACGHHDGANVGASADAVEAAVLREASITYIDSLPYADRSVAGRRKQEAGMYKQRRLRWRARYALPPKALCRVLRKVLPNGYNAFTPDGACRWLDRPGALQDVRWYFAREYSVALYAVAPKGAEGLLLRLSWTAKEQALADEVYIYAAQELRDRSKGDFPLKYEGGPVRWPEGPILRVWWD
mgnify:FL=1